MVLRAEIDTFVPWDKTWTNRMGVLDLLNKRSKNILAFLDAQSSLNDDLASLRSAVFCWEAGVPVDVGESGTLFRFLRFASWKLGLNKSFVVRGTLQDRDICDDPIIVDWPQEKLLRLDHGTSQWASAAVLLGSTERLTLPPFKLAVTYQAVKHWHDTRGEWTPRRDKTIKRQAVEFDLIHRGKDGATFQALQAEDFCFAYVFGAMSADEGAQRWPNLRGHESDRIVEIGMALRQAMQGDVVQSRDHRVVQAVAMWCKLNKKPLLFARPGAVNKSWPEFWNFLKQY